MPFEKTTFLSRETSSKCWCKFCCWVGGRFSRFVVIRARWTCSILGRWQEPTRERERDGRCDIYLYYILCVRDVHIYLYIHRERERETIDMLYVIRKRADRYELRQQQRKRRIDPFSFSLYSISFIFFLFSLLFWLRCPVPSTIHEMRCYKHIDTRRLLFFLSFSI